MPSTQQTANRRGSLDVGGVEFDELASPDIATGESEIAPEVVAFVGRMRQLSLTHAPVHLRNWPSTISGPTQAAELFQAIGSDVPITLDERPVTLGPALSGMCVRVFDHAHGIGLRLEQDPRVTEIFENGIIRCTDVLHPVARPDIGEQTFATLRRGKLFSEDETRQVLHRILGKLKHKLPIVWDATSSCELPCEDAPRLELCLAQRSQGLTLSLKVRYGNPPAATVEDSLCLLEPTFSKIPCRDGGKERELIARAQNWLGVSLSQPLSREKLHDVLAKLATPPPPEISVSGIEDILPPTRSGLTPHIEIGEGGEFSLFFRTFQPASHGSTVPAKVSVPARVVLDHYLSGAVSFRFEAFDHIEIPREWLEQHADILTALLAQRDSNTKTWHPHVLSDLRELLEAHEITPPSHCLAAIDAAIHGDDSEEPLNLGDFDGTLRPYQTEGIRWLNRLRLCGLGALLADDMGLGKTLQAILSLHPPTLIVAPTSLLAHWRGEIRKFRPSLSVCVYHGSSRKLLPDADVVITSFAIARQDRELLSQRAWESVIVDEAQNMKNPHSQTSQALATIPGRFRLALTGTPIENRASDLWSIFRFLQPQLLGDIATFEKRLSLPTPAARQRAMTRVRNRVRPYLLRRTKDQVLKDLPERNEAIVRVDLEPEERNIYNLVRAASREDLVQLLAPGASVMGVLESLMRLRQAACHPGLLPEHEAWRERASSKTRVLRARLLELQECGEKAVVFSQWTSLLDLVAADLKKAGITPLALDGRTRDRAKVVQEFSESQQPQVLLATLKVGGVGLNLTSARFAFILDPWWNPAAERQAADRIHRIGQERPVFIQKLVAADTIEEKISQLQMHKLAIADEILSGDTPAALSRGALLDLLKQSLEPDDTESEVTDWQAEQAQEDPDT